MKRSNRKLAAFGAAVAIGASAAVLAAPAAVSGASTTPDTVTAIPAAVASKLGVKGGVIVNSVRPGSFADEINLTKGFVIVEINKRPITDEASYKAIVTSLKSGDDVVFVVRGTGADSPPGNSYKWGTLP